MKMVLHCARGVDKGISQGGNPIEVMGLLLGRPDPLKPKNLIVTDAFPLPIEGFETRVVADDQDVVNHMIALNESLERSRNEKFMGWYHSHPFDLGDHSHCFLSQTDLSTQLQWQRAEDPHGNPFVAMVLDPLRSAHNGIPEIKAFRAYPPEYQSPIAYECPDGSVQPSEQLRLEHWGSCWNRYYELPVHYFMSSTSRSVLGALTQNYLWISNLKQQTPKHQMLQDLQQTAQLTAEAAVRGGASSSSHAAALAAAAAGPGGVASLPSASTTATSMVIDPPATMTGAAKDWETQMASKISQLATQQLAESTKVTIQHQIFQPTSSSP